MITSAIKDPYLDPSMKGWLVKTAKKNYYRIAGFELDDLIQEGLCCFFKCKERYPELRKRFPTKQERRHFMALVQTTFSNRIYDLAKRQSPYVEQRILDLAVQTTDDRVGDLAGRESDVWDHIIPSQDEEATAAALLASAPEEITRLLQLLVNDVLSYRRYGYGKYARRETNNRYFCRLLRLPLHRAILGEVKAHFGVVD